MRYDNRRGQWKVELFHKSSQRQKLRLDVTKRDAITWSFPYLKSGWNVQLFRRRNGQYVEKPLPAKVRIGKKTWLHL